MQYKPAILFLFLCFLLHRNVCAQSVLYSSTVSNNINTKFEVIGKVGNFYWLYKNKTIDGSGWPRKQERSFEVYDARLERVKQIPTALSDSVVKQYLVPQKYSFDQLIFKNGFNKTSVVVNRFTQDGDEVAVNAHLFDFPGQNGIGRPTCFPLTRSDKDFDIRLFAHFAGYTRHICKNVYQGLVVIARYNI